MTDTLTGHDVEEGELPEGWERKTMGEVGKYLNGYAFNSKTWSTSGRPIIRIQNLTGSGSKYNFFDGDIEERYIVREGDLLFSWSATLGVFVWNGPEAVLNQHIFKVESAIDTGFHRYLLENTVAEMNQQTHGSGMVHITKKKFEALPLMIPPEQEQERIVETLEDQLTRLDTALQSVQTVREKAAQFRRSLLHAAFTGALTGHDVEEGELPSGWSLCQFSEIANVDSNLVDPKPLGHLPHIAPNNIESDSGRLLQYRSTAEDGVTSGKHKFQRGHILYSKIRPYLNKVVVVDFEGLCSADMYPISTDQNISWLWMAMLSPSFVSQTSSTQTRTVLPKINIKELSRIEIPVPPLLEQERIVEILEDQLSRLDASLAVADAVEERSAALRRSLLHSAFTGRLTEGWREAVNV